MKFRYLIPLLLLSAPASAIDMWRSGNTLMVDGHINRGDDTRIVLDGIQTVSLDSDGGDVLTALRIGKKIKARNINTTVRGRCDSSCLLVLQSGKRRSAWAGASMIIHGATANNGNVAATKMMNKAWRMQSVEWGMDADFADARIKYGAPDYQIDSNEAYQYGILKQ